MMTANRFSVISSMEARTGLICDMKLQPEELITAYHPLIQIINRLLLCIRIFLSIIPYSLQFTRYAIVGMSAPCGTPRINFRIPDDFFA